MFDHSEYDDEDPAGGVASLTTVDDQVSVGVVAALGYVAVGARLDHAMAGSVSPGRVFMSTGILAN